MTIRRRGGIALLALLLVSGCASPEPYEPIGTLDEAAVICPDGVTTFGIDVSYWQGNINWGAVAGDGVEYAFIRVADGHFVDPDFPTNWAGAQSAGVLRGAYQFFRPGQDAVSQANLFLANMGPLQPGDLPPVLDVEVDDGMSDAWVVAGIHDWIDTVELSTGRQPIIYTSYYMWQSLTGNSYDFNGYPMWVANWGVNCPNVPVPWSEWVFWQTSESGAVAGIAGAVDTDEFNGDLADLLAFAGGGGVCTPGDTEGQACGNCGWQERTCDGGGQWGGWSSCQGQGVCSPGSADVQDCCDCGTQTRSCDGSCQWGGWSACAGPDPDGGAQWCDTGESGPCAEGRMRCVEGCLDCVRVHEPTPELCDTVDNDCDGAVDDGDPQELGEPVPAYAARLVDASYPATLAPGTEGLAWAEFENVGGETWTGGQLYLGATAAAEGQPSALYAEGAWPAWDIAAVLEDDVSPGARAFLAFPVVAPGTGGVVVEEEFRLMDPVGRMLDCPSPGLAVAVRVRSADGDVGALDGDAVPSPVPLQDGDDGCRCGIAGPPRTAGPGAALLAVAALGLALRRRRGVALAALLGALLGVGCVDPAPPVTAAQAVDAAAPAAPAESEGRPAARGRWLLRGEVELSLADGVLTSEDGAGERVLARAVLGEPAVHEASGRVVVAHRDDPEVLSAVDALQWSGGWSEPRRLASAGAPDRVALSGDGEQVAYFCGVTGIASLWLIPFDGGEAVQRTNVGLERLPREPGQPPAGFVPPPLDGAPRFEAGRLWWIAPDGVHEVMLP